MNEIDVGFIGAGMISLAHGVSLSGIISAQIFEEGRLHLKKVADVDENAASRFSVMTGIKEVSTDPMDVINDDSINVVYILTPTKFHKELFLAAAEKGKHVFCEKPLAFSSSDIKEMIKAREKNGILAQVGLVLRHCPIFWFIKKTIQDNQDELGNLLTVLFRDDQEWPIAGSSHVSDWRRNISFAHAGCLFEHSIHDVDILECIFGPMKNVFARIKYVSPLAKIGLEDSVNLNFEFNKGGTGSLISLWHKVKRDFRHLELFFENGSIIIDGYTGHGMKSFNIQIGKKKTVEHKWRDVTKEYIKTLNLPNLKTGVEMYSYENLSFINSIFEGKKPYPSLEIGLRAHEIVEAAYTSSKTQKMIDFT